MKEARNMYLEDDKCVDQYKRTLSPELGNTELQKEIKLKCTPNK